MNIVLATGNDHKKREFEKILPGIGIALPADHGIAFDVSEDGRTFYENAYAKAVFLSEKLSLPVLADDSGICVRALGGGPGIYSARYGSETGAANLSSEERNRYLLSKLKGVTDRWAAFVCCLVLIVGPYRVFSVQETVEGIVADRPSGNGGFGYDPIFFMPRYGKTMAQLSEAEKNRLSHRGRAGRIIGNIIRDLEVS